MMTRAEFSKLTEDQQGAVMLAHARAEGKGPTVWPKKVVQEIDMEGIGRDALRHITEQPGVTKTRLAAALKMNTYKATEILNRLVGEGKLRFTATRTGIRHYYPVKEVA